MPFETIPDYPEEYSATTVSARMIDGLGFRLYWATEGLQPEEIAFNPGEDTRSIHETLAHIYSLIVMIHNTHYGTINEIVSTENLTYDELRNESLNLLMAIRTRLTEESPDLDSLDILFKQGSLPYWNLINGPISDAIYHTGQIVLLRRMAGNPIRPDVDVFRGRIRD